MVSKNIACHNKINTSISKLYLHVRSVCHTFYVRLDLENWREETVVIRVDDHIAPEDEWDYYRFNLPGITNQINGKLLNILPLLVPFCHP